jgi:hypothetical protein
MFIGHFGVGFAAKRVAPRLSLGTAFLAAQFLDLLWPTLLLLGLETVRIVPGATAVTQLVFDYFPISHSLAAVLTWAGFLGAVYFFARKDTRSAIVFALLVLSHWLLDAVTHIPDLPLSPGGGPLVGLGLWQSLTATLTVEFLIFAWGVWLYVKSTPSMDRVGRWSLAGLVVFLALVHVSSLFGPPPPSVTAIAWIGQAQWLLVAWGYWVDSRCAAEGASEPKSPLAA